MNSLDGLGASLLPRFAARVDARNGVVSLALTGELDMAAVPVLEAQLAHFVSGSVAAIVIDLRDLAFIDCSGLRALLRARERAEVGEHRLILVGASPAARRLFDLTGTASMLDDREAVSVLDRFTGGQTRRTGKSAAAGVDADA